MKERPCIKCGSIERNSNGDCAPCQRSCSAEWKRKNKEAIIASGEPRFYTYIHRRADDGNVFYVGKGNGDRCKSYKDRNNYWKRIVNKHGIIIEIVAKFKTEEEAFDHEKYLINHYRGAGARLCNFTDGGDGPCGYRHTEETRQKLSSMQIGKTLSEEHKAKLSAALKGKPRPAHVIAILRTANIGRKRTPEQNRINSEQRKGKSLHPDTVKKISAANTGKKRSLEARKKMSIAAKKRGISTETLLKAHLATRGKKRSAEFCAKISAGLTGIRHN